MGGLKCSGACLWGKRLAYDPGTQGGPQEFAPLLLEQQPEVFPTVPSCLNHWTPKGLSLRTILYAWAWNKISWMHVWWHGCDEMHPHKCSQQHCITVITSYIFFYGVGAYLFSSNLNKHLCKSFSGLQDNSHLFWS